MGIFDGLPAGRATLSGLTEEQENATAAALSALALALGGTEPEGGALPVTATGAAASRTLAQWAADVLVPVTPESAEDGRASLLRTLRAFDAYGGKKVTWVGDSITEQGKPTMGSGPGLGVGFTTYIEQAFPNVTYSNQGVGGNTTLDVIARLATITATAADLYVLAIGINDARYNDSRGATTAATYVANVGTILDALTAAGGQAVVLSIWPSFWADQFASLGRKRTDERFREWNAALEAACVARGVPYVDAYSHLVRAVDLSNVATLIPDGVHPDYATTAAKRLYATAVLRGALNKAEFSSVYKPTGTVFYKLVVLDNGQADHLASIQNILAQPYHVEKFGYSANAAVALGNLFGSYSGAYAGWLNKASDFPLVFTFSGDQFLAGVRTVSRGLGRGIRSYELYLSTDPRALTDPSHPTWVLAQSEYSNAALAHNLLPAKRDKVFYRLQVDSSSGTDGPGGLTGTFVKLAKVWGGVEPVRWAYSNMLVQSTCERHDLIFSSAGGSASAYFANVANTYPLHVSWESPGRITSLVLASVGETGRNLKDWKLFTSRDPAAIGDAAHASWVQIRTGTGDGTVNLANDVAPAATVAASTATDVAGLKTDLNALIASLKAASLVSTT